MKTTLAKIPLYYYLVIGLLMAQAIFTVYYGGLVVGHGARVSHLERQKKALQDQTQALNQRLALSHSLIHIQASDLYNQFQPITQVIVATAPAEVLSR